MALVKYNNNSISNVTALASLPSGAMTHIKTITASSSSTLSFVHGSSDVVLDSTYPIYLFKFINIHPASDEATFQFNFSADTGSNYNVTKTTTAFEARHEEDDDPAALGYDTGQDLAQSTSFKNIYAFLGADADQSCSGEIFLFNPSSTTFVKHFLIRNSGIQGNDRARDNHYAGYANTTSAIDAVQFKMASGNIDAGTIKLYGIKDS
jgi:hypothetical protein